MKIHNKTIFGWNGSNARGKFNCLFFNLLIDVEKTKTAQEEKHKRSDTKNKTLGQSYQLWKK